MVRYQQPGKGLHLYNRQPGEGESFESHFNFQRKEKAAMWWKSLLENLLTGYTFVIAIAVCVVSGIFTVVTFGNPKQRKLTPGFFLAFALSAFALVFLLSR